MATLVGAFTTSDAQANQWTSVIGSPMSVVVGFLDFTKTWATAAGSGTPANLYLDAPFSNAVLCVSMPMAFADDTNGANAAFTAIVNGTRDAAINAILNVYKNLGMSRIILRPGWEMNETVAGDFPWCVGNPSSTSAGPSAADAAAFRAAWQHIWTLAKAISGIQIDFAWTPGAGWSIGSGSTSLYPGDGFVNFIGIDAYSDVSVTDPNFSVQSCAQLAVAHSKPMCFGELGVNVPGATSTWATFLPQVTTALQGVSGVSMGFVPYFVFDPNLGGTPLSDQTATAAIKNSIAALSALTSNTSITVVTPPQQTTASNVPISGTLLNYNSAPTLQYRVDAGSWINAPTQPTGTTSYSFSIPPLTAGGHTVSVRDANNTAIAVSTGTFQVVVPVPTVITPLQPSGVIANDPFTVRGTLSGYSSPPSLTYNDGTGAVALPAGAVVTTTSFTFTHPALPTATSFTTTISDGAGTAGSVSYTVSTKPGSASVNLSTITPVSGGALNDSAGNQWTIDSSLVVCENGVEDATTSGVQEMAWVNGQIWYENSSSQWFSKASPFTGSWAGPNPSPLGQPKTINITTLTGVSPATAFTVSGSLLNYPNAPALTWSDDSGAAQAIPSAGVTALGFTFTHPGINSGNHTITISDGTVSGTQSYSVALSGWTSLPATSNTSNILTGLQPGTPYDVEVVAVNSAGQSDPSAILTFTTTAVVPVLPSAPTGLTSTSTTNTSVNLSWTAPTVGSAPITYQTQWSPTGLNSWTNGPLVGPGVTTAQITGLSPGTTYDFQVQAINGAGSGPFSTIYTIATSGGTVATWSTTLNAPGVTFSNGNNTATAVGSSTPYSTYQGCFSSTSNATGQVWFQVIFNTLTVNCSVGIGNINFQPTVFFGGGDTNCAAFYPTGGGANEQVPLSAYFNNLPILSPSGSPVGDVNGVVVTVCVDIPNNQWWVQTPNMVATYGPNAWNDSPTAVPGVGAAGVGGMPIGVVGALYAIFATAEGGGVCTANFSATPIGNVVIPSAFASWGGQSQVVTAPNAVTGLTAGTPTSTSVPLSWTQPTVGTPTLTYTIQYKLHTAATYTTFGTTNNLNATVTGLSPSTQYDFQVFASNSAGTGPVSNTATATTAVTTALPGPPVGVAVGGATQTTLTPTWQNPTTGGVVGGTNGGFQVQDRKTGTTAWANGPAVRVVTPGAGSFSAGGFTWAINASGQITINGTWDGISAGVTQLVLINGTIWQNAANSPGAPGWYSSAPTNPPSYSGPTQTQPWAATVTGLTANTSYDFQVQATNPSGAGPFSTPVVSGTTLPTTGTNSFTVQNGAILGSNGQPFICRGMAIWDTQLSVWPASRVLQFFPKTNAIRLSVGNATHGFLTPFLSWTAMQNWINAATALGLVVILDDHEQSGATNPYTGSNLTTDLAYVTQVGNTYKNNPLVWIQSMNEPGGGGPLAVYHQAFYNAFRATGATNIVLHDGYGGNLPNPPSDQTGPYQSMFNCGWDGHAYNWMTHNALGAGYTNQSQVNSLMSQYVANWKAFTNFSNGSGNNNTAPCVWVGECGWIDYANNSLVDVGGADGTNTIVQWSLTSGNGSSGTAQWLLDGTAVGFTSVTDMNVGGTNTVHGNFWNSL